MIHQIIGFALAHTAMIDEAYQRKRDELREEWRRTKTMPRKMKKRRRKELQIDWSINEFTKPLQF